MITGPSGVGKGTLISAVRDLVPELELSTSATTRARRAGEVDGVDYHFLSREDFLRLRADRFRRPGTWSWKNLVNRVAHRKYHGWHVEQLRALAIASGDPWFGRLARLFASDYP